MSLSEKIEEIVDVLNDLTFELENDLHNEYIKDLDRSSVSFVSFSDDFDTFEIFIESPEIDDFEYLKEDGSYDTATITCNVDYFFKSVLDRLVQDKNSPEIYESFRLKILQFAENIEQLKKKLT